LIPGNEGKEAQTMHQYKELSDFATALDIKMAIVEVQAGETDKEAWERHLQDHPYDADAMVKVFNQPQIMRQTSHA
jgi:hypothetical protein